jgi:hypothetical protein
MNALFVGYSTANECTFSYSTKTARSAVSCDSLNISGTFDVLGDAACYEFGKPWVCCLIFCQTFIFVSNSFSGRWISTIWAPWKGFSSHSIFEYSLRSFVCFYRYGVDVECFFLVKNVFRVHLVK